MSQEQEIKVAPCAGCDRDVREPTVVVACRDLTLLAHARCRSKALARSGLAWLRGQR